MIPFIRRIEGRRLETEATILCSWLLALESGTVYNSKSLT